MSKENLNIPSLNLFNILKALMVPFQLIDIATTGFFIVFLFPFSSINSIELPLAAIWLIQVLFFLLTSYLLYLTLKSLITNQLMPKQSPWLIIPFLIETILLVYVIALTIVSTYNPTPPNFFPFNDNQATYTIIIRDGLYKLSYKSTSERNKFITCDSNDGKKRCQTEINNDVETMIGNCNQDLSIFIGKPVIVTGKFAYNSNQCVQNKCKYLGSNWAVVDINSIQLK